MSKAQNAPETGQLVSEMSDADLASLLLQVRAAEEGFLGFVKLMHPEWKIPKYQLDFIELLDKLERRELLNKKGEPVYNLLVNMPPRHNKSTLATKLFPAYCICRSPWSKILVSSSKRPCRILWRGNPCLFREPTHQACFPALFHLQQNRSKGRLAHRPRRSIPSFGPIREHNWSSRKPSYSR